MPDTFKGIGVQSRGWDPLGAGLLFGEVVIL